MSLAPSEHIPVVAAAAAALGDDDRPIAAVTRMTEAGWLARLRRQPRPYPAGLVLPIILGIRNGVDIGFAGDRLRSRRARNLPSATNDERVFRLVTAAIQANVAAGKTAGPFDRPPFLHFSVSPIGAVVKGDPADGKIRVIHHLSHPHGIGTGSINDGIAHEDLTLARFEDAMYAVVRAGRGCYLIKLDVEAAYKQVPVCRADRALLGLKWDGKYYYELVLPFGLRSSGHRWEMYAAALHHFFEHHLGVELVIHYVDDFLFVIPARLGLAAATAARDGAVDLCAELRVPLSLPKLEGPTTCLGFLGIEIDTIAMEARLGDKRVAELRSLLDVWAERRSCTLVQLQSLTGKLFFAAKVVRRGRTYLRRLIDMQRCFVVARTERNSREEHELSAEARHDVTWWRSLLLGWNGITLLPAAEWTDARTDLGLYTDACGTGYGAAFGDRWIRGEWSARVLAKAQRVSKLSMPFLELLSLVLAALTWGAHWGGKRITFRCDCQPVVYAIEKMSSKDSDMQGLLRLLDSTAARFSFDYRCTHIAGVDNTVADLLSRPGLFSLPALQSLLPSANAKQDDTALLPRWKDM